MRIVSGKYRGRRVSLPKKFPSRPTTDYAKEALFNILENRIDWDDTEVLDLFAGTGNISLEFLSRGVKNVQSIDKHPASIKQMHKMKSDFDEENWLISRMDVFRFLDKNSRHFDLIFADPPFGTKELSQIINTIFEKELINKNGLLIVEHGRETDFETHPNFQEVRNYGGVKFSFFC